MLTEREKEKLASKWWTHISITGRLPQTVCPPKIGCVYAFEMSDNTVKIGATQDADRRAKEIPHTVYLDILRRHNTDYAPFSFITKIERACHAAFADRRVRGEYFNITFEEAVAELNRHAEKILNARANADAAFLDEVNFFFDEFVPEFQNRNQKVQPALDNQSNFEVVEGTIAKPEEKVEVAPADKADVATLMAEIARLKNQIPKIICVELAVVYVLLLSNGTVKIGMTSNLNERIKQIKAETKLDVFNFKSTPYMPKGDALKFESFLKQKYAAHCLVGEYFDVNFLEVCEHF